MYPLQEGTNLWSYGIFVREKDRSQAYFLGLASGQVGIVQKDGEMAYDNLLQIIKLIPYGGLSGAPVITREGRIIGTISGGLPYSEQRIPFTGASVAKVEDLNILSRGANSALFTIPLNSTK